MNDYKQGSSNNFLLKFTYVKVPASVLLCVLKVSKLLHLVSTGSLSLVRGYIQLENDTYKEIISDSNL